MSKELAILAIHGMGSQSSGFADEMITEINQRVSNLGKDPDEIAWGSVYWANILEPRQLKYLRNAKRSGNLDFLSLRKFVLTALGDACAYQQVNGTQNTTYEQIHKRVSDEIERLYTIDLDAAPKPLIIFAHSLGGHIMSNYIWDMQQSSNTGVSDFESMKHLAGFVTFGCNIPLFTFAYSNVLPIAFPGSRVSDKVKRKAKWLNYYDPDDVLGYPLKPINAAYRGVVNKDIPINVGGVFSSWNPMSHSKYWTDNDFTKPASKFIANFL